nr:hypothetical protein [Tanacetum cinerariifolium]
VLDALDKRHIGEDASISCRDKVYRLFTENQVQIPKDDLDNLQSVGEEETLELDPQDLLGSILLGTFLALGFLVYTNVTTGLSVLLTIGMGSLGGTIVAVEILVKGHTFPTGVKVHPVGFH